MDARNVYSERENELALINTLVQEWGTRHIIFVDAPAGIGKTHLLRAIQQRYSTNDVHRLPIHVAELIDFQDDTLHILQNISYRLAHAIDPHLFDPFLFLLFNWQRMEINGISAEQRDQSLEALNRTFVDCVNAVSAQRRPIFLFDSIEMLQSSPVLRNLLEMAYNIENGVFLFVGRNAEHIGSQLQRSGRQDVSILGLEPLSQQTSLEYMQTYLPALSSDQLPLREVAWLTEGHPIMLDLAALYALSGEMMAWVQDQVGTLPGATTGAGQLQRTFVHRLVRMIATPDTLEGRIVLLLARVYPADAAMVAVLLDAPLAEVRGRLGNFKGARLSSRFRAMCSPCTMKSAMLSAR
ncbi:MAG: ATP-binding protein [Chloroflexaceae bacterium]|nr:ATP-binding protein [Chloroflexaceae bacterium]